MDERPTLDQPDEPEPEPNAPPPWPEPETPQPVDPDTPGPYPEPATPEPFPEPDPPPGPPLFGSDGTTLALWPKRVQSALVDWYGPGLVVALVAPRSTLTVGLTLQTAVWVWALYNAWLAGTAGQSVGKRWAGTRLTRADDGTLVGGWMAMGRHLLHVLDLIAFHLGLLWPLWDRKRQTFADKIVRSVVVLAPS